MKSKTIIASIMLLTQVSFAAPVHSELIHSSERASSREIFSSSGMERHSLTMIFLSPLVVAGQTVGEIVVYDDPTTKRPADYFGLYDGAGDLVAVGWFDQFGIQRNAVDRAFVNGGDEPEGVFVSLVGGDFI